VIILETPMGISYGHSGFFPGYLTQMAYYPEHEIAVAIQVNCSVPRALGRPLGDMLNEIATAAMEGLEP
jgi:D-alanyl-D-alanine carboxypeptidase